MTYAWRRHDAKTHLRCHRRLTDLNLFSDIETCRWRDRCRKLGKKEINNMTTYQQDYSELCELFGVESETLAINPPYLVD